MPNGHGGIPHFGSPVLLALMFFAGAFWPLAPDAALQWARFAVCLALAALAGWRFAYHLHMWRAEEYSGYMSPEEYRRAARRYAGFAAVYATLGAGAGFALLGWRGLP
jgi:hypothetical protein